MKPERAFIADRPLAQHCPELLRAGPAPAELTPTLTKFGDRLIASGDALVAAVRSHAPGEQVQVTYEVNGQSRTATVTLEDLKVG